MSRPPRMANAIGSCRRFLCYEFPERRNSAGALACFDLLAINYRNTCGIVTAIFKTTQPVKQDGSCFRTTNVTDNTAHVIEIETLTRDRRNKRLRRASLWTPAHRAVVHLTASPPKRLMGLGTICVNLAL